MLSALLFTTFLWVTNAQGDWETCGLPSGCYCSRPVLHQIHCRNITVFPIFEDYITPGVLTVTISDSDIAGLPPFRKEEWDRLKRVQFTDTPLLSCKAISDIRREGLHVLSECACAGRECLRCKEGGSTTICLGALLMLVMCLVIGLGFILYRLHKRQVCRDICVR